MIESQEQADNEFDAVVVCIDTQNFYSIMPEAFIKNSFDSDKWKKNNVGTGLKINGVLKTKPSTNKEIKTIMDLCPSTAFIYQDTVESMIEGMKIGNNAKKDIIWELIFPSLMFEEDACDEHITFSIYSTPHLYIDSIKSNMDYRKKIESSIFASIEKYFPDFEEKISWCETLTPVDIENRFNVSMGNVDHGNMTPADIFLKRSIYTGTGNTTQIGRVFFSGSGSTPGGLVTGIPGMRVAKVIGKSIT